jgi:hypothetical protein
MSQPINCIHSRGMKNERRKEHSIYNAMNIKINSPPPELKVFD